MVGLTVAFFDLIRVFFGQVKTLRGRDHGVFKPSVRNWTRVWGIQKLSSVSKILKTLQICYSVSEAPFTKHNVGDLLGCGGAGCGKVLELFISRGFRGNFWLTCVKMYNIFKELDKIYYKILHLGSPESSLLIDTRVEVDWRKLLQQLNSNKCCKILLWF